MKTIKKRLVFYFYATPEWREERAIKIHLECLKRYAHVFDEALFIISLDYPEDKELIKDVEIGLISLGFKDIKFKIHKNSPYCEAEVFHDEVVDNLDKLDGLTFFGHTKGVTNYNSHSKDSIDNWIIGLYYLSLEFIDEVEQSLCFYENRFYGSFLSLLNNHFYYDGAFFWINCCAVANDIKNGYVSLPKYCYSKSYSKEFPSQLYWDSPNESSTMERKDGHDSMYLYASTNKSDSLYENSESGVWFILSEGDEFEEFKKVRDNILEKVDRDA